MPFIPSSRGRAPNHCGGRFHVQLFERGREAFGSRGPVHLRGRQVRLHHRHGGAGGHLQKVSLELE